MLATACSLFFSLNCRRLQTILLLLFKFRNDYELITGNDTKIKECLEYTQIPAIKYNFIPINDIEAMQAGTFVDIIAVVKSSGDLVNITSKAGKELIKREVVLVDQSETAITLTLWGDDA